MTSQEHISNTFWLSILTIIAMATITEIVLPLQGNIFPDLGPFAALIFPIHGIRVLCAWMYGWWSVIYLFVAYIVTALLYELIALDTPYVELTSEGLMSCALVSVTAIFSLKALKLVGLEAEKINTKSWRQLILVAVISSVLNTFGHSFIFSDQFIVIGERNAILSHIIGDTLGTAVCLAVLILLFRFVRIRMKIT